MTAAAAAAAEGSALMPARRGAQGGYVDSSLFQGGRLVLGGDHRQLPCILHHDFSDEMRPVLMRWRVGGSAYDYVLQLARGEGH
jgi:hypothetical protein